MAKQYSLPTLGQAKVSADTAIQKVTDNADDEWKAWAYKAGQWLARNKIDFIADDFHPLLEQVRDKHGITVHDKRALGGVVRKLQRDGVIAPIPGRYRPSRRRHKTPQQIWKGC